MKYVRYIWILMFALYSCTGVKYLTENEQFYIGADLNIVDSENAATIKPVLNELGEVIKPKPNERLLGMRPSVWINEVMGSPPKKGIRRYLKRTLGKEAVLYNPDIPEKTIRLLENRLFNLGYFDRRISFELEENEKEVLLKYEVTLGKPFVINEITLPKDSTVLSKEIKKIEPSTFLKKDAPYNLEILKSERERIDEHLKNKGFYYFNPEYILYEVDSTIGNHRVDIQIKYKEVPSQASLNSYQIGHVFVYPNYDLQRDSVMKATTGTIINEVTYKDPENKFRFKIFEPLIFLQKGKNYQINDHNLTLKRLSDLNAFKFMNIRFYQSDTLLNALNAHIFLTPLSTHTLRFDVEAASKSNNFVGPNISLFYKNRNARHGAEVLAATLSAGFETQINGKSKTVNSYELGLNLSATIPRLISPIRFKVSPTAEIPKSRVQLKQDLLQRSGYYRINKTNIDFGYLWHTNTNRFHQLKLIDVSYVFLNSTTPEFDLLLTENTTLKQSFEDQFIIGGGYSYTFSNQVKNQNKNYLYFNINFDLSGNVLQLFNSTLQKGQDNRNELFGQPYSQFTRVDLDLRYTWSFNEAHKLASRLLLGVGVPYGNSAQLPYVKQFFIGGSSSIRAFPARGIGPGSYRSESNESLFLDQSGDMKLEGNLEYRAKIYGVFRGAIFLDAGNVWLLNNDNKPEGNFHIQNLYKELGVGTGLGLRMDFDFFVLRFDWAFPLKKPYILESNGWVFDTIDFGSKSWRKENLVLNIAIGYSF